MSILSSQVALVSSLRSCTTCFNHVDPKTGSRIKFTVSGIYNTLVDLISALRAEPRKLVTVAVLGNPRADTTFEAFALLDAGTLADALSR